MYGQYELTEENRQKELTYYLNQEQELLKYLKYRKFIHAWHYGIADGLWVLLSVWSAGSALALLICMFTNKYMVLLVWPVLIAASLAGWMILVCLHEHGICRQKRECLTKVRRAIRYYRYEYF